METDGLCIRGLTVTKGGRRILAGLSGDLPRVGYWVVVGGSGTGKTTLLRALAGLEEVGRETQVMWDGREITRSRPEERGVALLFQEDTLLPHLDVSDNVGLPLRLRGRSRIQAREAAVPLLTRMGLRGHETRLPTELSGGERQRVALARALAGGASILLLDEPLARLDWGNRIALCETLRRLPSEWHCLVIHVTHDPTEAWCLADQVAVLDSGCWVQTGDAATLYRQPAHVSVMGIFGWPPVNWWLPAGTEVPGAWRAALRPEDVQVRVASAPTETGLPGWIEESMQAGVEHHLRVRLEGPGGIRLWSLRFRDRHEEALPAGTRVTVSWVSDALHWFDAGSGCRLPGAVVPCLMEAVRVGRILPGTARG